MKDQGGRSLSQRDLHHLSTADLLALIQEDIQDLDLLIKSKPAREPAQKGRGRKTGGRRRSQSEEGPSLQSKQVTLDELIDEPAQTERLPLYTVTCCNHTMGDFPASARVRCPFCCNWHRAGDFPQAQ